ncbi:MAG: hypothetical protein GX591_01380 [Planctomycetes bacterium]|nr:hypothetical protein [Planctomycetota bacterium]
MTKVLIAMTLVAVFLLGGCTMTESPSEHYRRIADSQELQMRMLVEDIEMVLLLTRPEYSTPWAIRKGLPN